MLETDTKIFCVSARGTKLTPLELDMTLVYRAESRVPEVAVANYIKAQELSAYFNEAYGTLIKLGARIEEEIGVAETELKKRKSVVVIDILPGILKSKELANSRSPLGSEDVREAFLYKDEDYLRLLEVRNQLNAVKSLIEGKTEQISRSYWTCQKLLTQRPAVPDLANQFRDDPVDSKIFGKYVVEE